jgi:Cu(I)/Ag(I) efflux system protein CusF
LDKKHINGLTRALIIIPLFGIYPSVWAAEPSSVLDPAQHPKSPEYQSTFSSSVIPLDSKLSWTKRFNGDETFNTEVRLVPGASITTDASSHTMKMKSEPMMGMKMDGQGVIKKLKLAQSKIKISHGTIDKYGMPAMTMVFKVEDLAMLEGLEKNQKIGFNVDNSSGGFVVTHIMPVVAMVESSSQKASTKMDVRGVIQVVRESQGKVKIKHGPIDKYGMPGMTMMFKVTDAALLKGLQKGSQVDFNIDNSSGGFVITDIVPVEE